MKRRMGIALLLSAMCLIFSASTAGAVKFYGCQFNEPTFETLEETRLSGPEAIKDLPSNQGKVFVSHPVLDGYPEGTTFVYRSANMYGDRAAARMNTNLLVFAQKHFENKENAETYLRELGLIDIADHSIGSVVLVTPADGEAFGQADQTNYYKLQTAMLAQKAGGKDAEGNEVSYSDAEYYGGYGYLYVIGIDEGATFLNNYVASTFDYSSRIAGMLLINGDMERIRQVASLVPTYLVNADTAILTKYQKANNTNAYYRDADDEVFFNQELPLQKVIVARDGNRTNADYIKHAYYEYFVKAMRVPVIKAGLYTAATPYQGGAFDEAPYSLCDRNAIFDGKTEDGIYLFSHVDDTFKDIVSSNGDFMETWFEYLPEEVLNNTAAPGSIPLVLANHGGGDDPRLFVDEIGLLSLQPSTRVFMVASLATERRAFFRRLFRHWFTICLISIRHWMQAVFIPRDTRWAEEQPSWRFMVNPACLQQLFLWRLLDMKRRKNRLLSLKNTICRLCSRRLPLICQVRLLRRQQPYPKRIKAM